MTLDSFLDLLDGVKAQGSGYVAVCPAHEDTNPSLSITEDERGVGVKCHAECTAEEIVTALGLHLSDLFADARPAKAKHIVDYANPESVFEYVDEQGNMIFQCLRYPGKVFKQRHRGPDGDWVWNLQDVRRVLYHLPEVLAAGLTGRTVYITEGEKDADRLREEGKVATCNPMGAGKWRDEYAEMLRGCNVIIIADRDEPGRNHANKIRATLVGVARSVYVMQAKSGKDVSDHLDAGHEIEELVVRRERARKGIVSAFELAEAGREELNLKEADLPGYRFSPVLPIEFRPGRVYTVGAYTSDGKSRFGLQGFRELAQQGVHTGLFSLEMPEADLRHILVAHDGVPLRFTEHPWSLKQQPDLMQKYMHSLESMSGWNADIIVEAHMDGDKIVEYTRDREYDVVIVDHLHRFSWGQERRSLEAQVQKLTNLALDANVCVVLFCQLRRASRGQGMEVYPKPTLADFRETSVIEQEASMALSIWRQRTNGTVPTGGTLVEVLKNRHTTGAHDRVGAMYYPRFDPDRECFTHNEGSSNADEDPTAPHAEPPDGTSAWD